MTFGNSAGERPFAHRDPTEGEVELFRLLLSTFQDGSGQLKGKSGTLPGWRDYERTIAEITGGVAPEDKGIFDVLVSKATTSEHFVGLSGKMRQELRRIDRDGRVTIELSNSARKMWEALGEHGMTTADYKGRADEVGNALVNLVKQWHGAASTYKGRPVDISGSSYLALMWNRATGEYQLFKFPLTLPDPSTLKWYFTTSSKGHLNGDDSSGGRVFEWYGESGGQLKYYPLGTVAAWKSQVFRLEQVPAAANRHLAGKAAAYFPALWKAAVSGSVA